MEYYAAERRNSYFSQQHGWNWRTLYKVFLNIKNGYVKMLNEKGRVCNYMSYMTTSMLNMCVWLNGRRHVKLLIGLSLDSELRWFLCMCYSIA